ncbi:ABC transporter substrate-binding protein [Paenirhodobacter sp.]|uniref:ABC transporter substrate-binding protein n=1 Tax=Paenirhodobacter sp. TaxID=1965326 RepID=UPI003B423DED
MPFVSRRSVLIAALAAPAVLRAAPPATLALYGPPAGPSITLVHAVTAGLLKDIAPAEVVVWRTPDELRAGLTSGRIGLSVVPVQAAANLYNRGMGLRLVNVMTDGLLSIVAPEGAAPDLAGLVGRRLAVPFVNDTPDIVLRALLTRAGLAGKVEQVPVGSPVEAAQMLLAGQVDAALLSEPAASAVGIRGKLSFKSFVRSVDIQDAWAAVSGRGALPQAGLAVSDAFARDHGDLLAPIQSALERAVAGVLADPGRAAKEAAATLDFPAPVIAASIPHSRLVARPARQARADIEPMLSLMAETDPALIGGRLPDDGFYVL